MGRMILGALIMFAGGAVWRSSFDYSFTAEKHVPVFIAGMGMLAAGALLNSYGARSLRKDRK